MKKVKFLTVCGEQFIGWIYREGGSQVCKSFTFSTLLSLPAVLIINDLSLNDILFHSSRWIEIS